MSQFHTHMTLSYQFAELHISVDHIEIILSHIQALHFIDM